MKRSLLCAALTAVAFSVPVAFAVDGHHPDQDKKSAPAAKSAPAKPAATVGTDTAQMQGNMKKMQEQMDKIRKTTDPKERQKLMQEHMQAMQDNMKSMRGMGGPMMTVGGQHGSMTMSGKKDDEAPRNDGKTHGHDANDDGADDAA